MNRFWKLGLLAALVVGVAAAAYFLMPGEPSYSGRSLSAWVQDFQKPYFTQMRAVQAVREIGTNGLPRLREMLRQKDSRLKTALAKLLNRQNLPGLRIVPARERRINAAWACKALGPKATPLISELLAITPDDAASFNAAMFAMSEMGEDAALPLAGALQMKSPAMRQAAAGALGNIGAQAKSAVPALIRCLADNDMRVRGNAAWALGMIGDSDPDVIAALCKFLGDVNSPVRCNALSSLMSFGTNAQGARPLVLKLLDDPDEDVRTNAAVTLKKITPEPAN